MLNNVFQIAWRVLYCPRVRMGALNDGFRPNRRTATDRLTVRRDVSGVTLWSNDRSSSRLIVASDLIHGGCRLAISATADDEYFKSNGCATITGLE